MANWVNSNFAINSKPGHEQELVKFKNSCFINELNVLGQEESRFDFNAFVPMPKGIELSQSTTEVTGWDDFKKQGDKKLKDVKMTPRLTGLITALDLTDENTVNDVIKALEDKHYPDVDLSGIDLHSKESREDIVLNFKIVEYQSRLHEENLQNYGYATWYDWSIENWGTKWNASHTQIHDEGSNFLVFSFDTAWGMPTPIYEKMVEDYPNLEFSIEVTEEAAFFAYHITQDDDGQLVYTEYTQEEMKQHYQFDEEEDDTTDESTNHDDTQTTNS